MGYKREVLFRAISTETGEGIPASVRAGEWVFGYPVFDRGNCSLHCENQHQGNLITFFAWIDELHEYDEVAVDPDTIGMYIGTKDANDIMVFEGDILERLAPKSAQELILGDRRGMVQGAVVWHDGHTGHSGRWMLRVEDRFGRPLCIELSASEGKPSKVIGTIHDAKTKMG